MKQVLTFLFFTVVALHTYGQITTNELPPSYYEQNGIKTVNNYTLEIPQPNLTPIIEQDKAEDSDKSIPWRFGTVISTSIKIQSINNWNDDDHIQQSTWKLRIKANSAISINANFNKFYLPETAKLYVYNDDYTDLLGALTSNNNKIDSLFAIRPIKGEAITFELTVPTQDKHLVIFEINEIIYGYRDLHTKIQTAFQSSGNCNPNVNCPPGDKWQDIKRSVAMITTNANSRICTGALINNAAQDSLPYLLTAAHCSVANNSIYIFNYESPSCSPNTDGILNNSINGSSRKAIAVNFGSDFELRLLSSTPPLHYNVYYAGWSAINLPPLQTTCIHHPSGDVKKISKNFHPATNSSYYGSGITHWEISNWEIGTTEIGSSGSPLFDQNQRIVGQLHGGDALCGNNAQDYFGKFSYSWNQNGPNAINQLKPWLDPFNTGITVLDGLDPNPAPFNYNLSLVNIYGMDEFFCGSTVQPTITVKNLGNSKVDSFYIKYSINGFVDSIFVINSLIRNQVLSVQLPILNVNNGQQTFACSVQTIGNTDQDMSNNVETFDFRANSNTNPTEVYLALKTDDYGSETSWILSDDSTNTVLYSSPKYPDINGGSVYYDTLCVFNGCLKFSLFDSQGDGFNDPSGFYGNGYALITLNPSDTLYFENTFYNTTVSDTFCLSFKTSIAEHHSRSVANIYPNPIRKGEKLNLPLEVKSYTLFDITSKKIIELNSNNLTIPYSLEKGVYFIQLHYNHRLTQTKKVMVID